MRFFIDWKTACIVYKLLEPFIEALFRREVPSRVTKLYENLAKFSSPAIDSLFKLKEKIKDSENSLDDECFKIGVGALKAFRDYLSGQIEKLEA